MRCFMVCCIAFIMMEAVSALPKNIIKPLDQIHHDARVLLNAKAKPLISFKVANKTLFQRTKYKQAYQALLPLAQTGNPLAQMEVGFLYEFGHGVSKQSYKTAAKWYYLAVVPYVYNQSPLKRAAKAYYGIGEPVNYKKAALWFRMAAELSVDRY